MRLLKINSPNVLIYIILKYLNNIYSFKNIIESLVIKILKRYSMLIALLKYSTIFRSNSPQSKYGCAELYNCKENTINLSECIHLSWNMLVGKDLML